MPVVKIFYPTRISLINGSKFHSAGTKRKIEMALYGIRPLALKKGQVSFLFLEEKSDSDIVVVEVTVDKKPERTKEVLDTTAKGIKNILLDRLKNEEGLLIEVFVTAFDHSTNGFA